MNELEEQIKTIRNLCDVCLILINQGQIVNKGSLLATEIELLFQECQNLTDEHCVIKE